MGDVMSRIVWCGMITESGGPFSVWGQGALHPLSASPFRTRGYIWRSVNSGEGSSARRVRFGVTRTRWGGGRGACVVLQFSSNRLRRLEPEHQLFFKNELLKFPDLSHSCLLWRANNYFCPLLVYMFQ